MKRYGNRLPTLYKICFDFVSAHLDSLKKVFCTDRFFFWYYSGLQGQKIVWNLYFLQTQSGQRNTILKLKLCWVMLCYSRLILFLFVFLSLILLPPIIPWGLLRFSYFIHGGLFLLVWMWSFLNKCILFYRHL